MSLAVVVSGGRYWLPEVVTVCGGSWWSLLAVQVCHSPFWFVVVATSWQLLSLAVVVKGRRY